MTYKDNVALDGDSCEEDKHCRSSDTNKPTCTEGVCLSSIKVGEPCGDNEDVPRGHYCNGGTTTALIKDGEACDPTQGKEFCGDNSFCVGLEQDDKTTKNTCVLIWSQVAGTIFKNIDPTPRGAGETFFSPICDSNTAFSLDDQGRVQCRKPTKNAKTGEDGLRRDNNTAACPGTRYSNADETKYDEPVEGNLPSTAKCGFNKVENAYCPYQFGDDEVLKVITPDIEAAQKLECSKWSTPNPKEGVLCAATMKNEASDGAFKRWSAYNMGINEQKSVNVMNNDKCVAETIMADFWQGNFDSALARGVLGVCASLLAFILL